MAAAAIPIIIEAVTLAARYGPGAVAGGKAIYDAIRSHPETTDEAKALLDKAEARLDAVNAAVQAAPVPERQP